MCMIEILVIKWTQKWHQKKVRENNFNMIHFIFHVQKNFRLTWVPNFKSRNDMLLNYTRMEVKKWSYYIWEVRRVLLLLLVLFSETAALHMQSGIGNVYNDPLGFLTSIPFWSLWRSISRICRLKSSHLHEHPIKYIDI